MTLIVLSLVLAGVSGAVTQRYWLPLREVARQGYITLEGAPTPRYQFRYVQDAEASDTCILVLTDEETGRFALTAIPRASCEARGGQP